MARIAHVLYEGLPSLSGYSLRSKYIIRELLNYGYTQCALVSPYGNTLSTLSEINVAREIDEVPYYRMGLKGIVGKVCLRLPRKLYRQLERRQFSREMAHILQTKRISPTVVHAHSPYLVGEPSIQVANQCNISSIYEVRGMWQDTQIAESSRRKLISRYQYHEFHELKTCQLANAVITISEGLRAELIEKGIPASKITIVPNGVDTEIFRPHPPNEALRDQLKLKDCFVVGYISSLRRLEGLDYLITAFSTIAERFPHARLLIVGDGPVKEELESQAEALRIGERVIFTGRVNHDQIRDYYSILDLFVVPRINARVCHIVTPLKPLEAMAMGIPIIASNVGGLRELIADEKTGLLFGAEDTDDLAHKLTHLITNSDLRTSLAESAREWVKQNRQWRTVVGEYLSVYEALDN